MTEFLWIGTGLGAALGILHAICVFRQQRTVAGRGVGTAAYFALWTVALWTLFGAYLLFFWILGATGLAVSRVIRPKAASS